MKFSEAVEHMTKGEKVVCKGWKGYFEMSERGQFGSSNIQYHDSDGTVDCYIFLSKCMLEEDWWQVLEEPSLTWEQALRCMYKGKS